MPVSRATWVGQAVVRASDRVLQVMADLMERIETASSERAQPSQDLTDSLGHVKQVLRSVNGLVVLEYREVQSGVAMRSGERPFTGQQITSWDDISEAAQALAEMASAKAGRMRAHNEGIEAYAKRHVSSPSPVHEGATRESVMAAINTRVGRSVV